MKQWMEDFTIDQLPGEDIKLVADYFGVNMAIKLLEELPGTLIHIPKTGLNKLRNQYICQVYDGSKECRVRLAQKFGVSKGYIKQLASRYRKKIA